jgi:hypothetical protein
MLNLIQILEFLFRVQQLSELRQIEHVMQIIMFLFFSITREIIQITQGGLEPFLLVEHQLNEGL